MNRRFVTASIFASLPIFLLAAATAAHGASITYVIPDIGTFAGYEDTNTSDTFSGQGFLGIYPTFPNDLGPAGPSFAHLLGLENHDGIYSETEMEVDTAALSGSTIVSATLSYDLSDGDSSTQSVTATSFSANGTLAYNQTPPSDLGTTTFTSNGLSANSADVTGLVSASVNADQTWLGLYLSPNGPVAGQWTWTDSEGSGGGSLTPDAADVRLTVDYTPVPEPSTVVLMLCAGLIAVTARRVRNAAH